jgi:amidohydrolase
MSQKNALIAASLVASVLAAWSQPTQAAERPAASDSISRAVAGIEPKVIDWYRDIHAHPELANEEVRTARLVAEYLRQIGFEVRTQIARTGVVGVLRGARPGGVVALRADMDALPVEERTGLPYASKARGVYRGQSVGVMHACGHDAHIAMLLGAAKILSDMRAQLAGTVVVLFQPSEEERPNDEPAGAELMIAEGALGDPRPDAIFGLHVVPYPSGRIGYRSGPLMAAQETFTVRLVGRQTHGSSPWTGINLMPLAAEIVTALSRIPADQVDLTRGPTVLTIGRIRGGEAANVIPGQVELEGTMRALDEGNRTTAIAAIKRIVSGTAATAGATGTVAFKKGYPVTANDPALTARILPVLRGVAGSDDVQEVAPVLAAEDFAYYQQQIPGVFIFLGINPDDAGPDGVHPNHSDRFRVNEAVLKRGVEIHVRLALDQLARP